jgi:hypothetical protein
LREDSRPLWAMARHTGAASSAIFILWLPEQCPIVSRFQCIEKPKLLGKTAAIVRRTKCWIFP